MKSSNEKIPSPKELEKEIGEFLSKKFGPSVKVSTPMILPQAESVEVGAEATTSRKSIQFDLKPEALIHYLDQYVVKQDEAKSILATKICTHFNRIKHTAASDNDISEMVGHIKNNVLMIGPTGVGKTYIIKLIANKIGVPFVKGDATKFSETGYVGGDVEDLVRDLVREADDDIELAQYGIIYIDEIDKIASSNNFIGADVSRTGVQRALLKPMEETEVDMKVPHDPISMIQEIERFRKTGKREKNSINTKNLLFIMSGAFGGLTEIISKRIKDQAIGFGAKFTPPAEQSQLLRQIKSEDLIAFGFESEFVGRLPVRAIFEELVENDLYQILKNPNNPIILGKKLDFKAYGIDIKIDSRFLRILAEQAALENTGARGLVSVIERALLPFETKLPSTSLSKFPITESVVHSAEEALAKLLAVDTDLKGTKDSAPNENGEYDRLALEEKKDLKAYIRANEIGLTDKYSLILTQSRIDLIAEYYSKNIMDVGSAIQKIKSFFDEIKKIELIFYQNHDINLVLEDDAIDFIIEGCINSEASLDAVYKKLCTDFEHGLKLVREKSGRNRFFITREALLDPETHISTLVKEALSSNKDLQPR